MHRAILILAAVSALVLAVLAAGCGGGGGSSTTPLSKDEFVSKADSICTEANKNEPKPPADLAGVDPTSAKATDEQLDEFADYIDEVGKVFQKELAKLNDLTPPTEFQTDYKAALTKLGAALAKLEDSAKAAREHNRAELKKELAISNRLGSEANAIAKKLGLKVCGAG